MAWTCLNRFVEMRSPWLTVIGENWRDDQQQRLEYWRVEKADSLIILPKLDDRLLLPPKMYRPGIDQYTLDFPGGRLPLGKHPAEMIPQILQRELHLSPSAIGSLTVLNPDGWAVNSSFSNQKVYGYLAEIIQTEYPQTDDLALSYALTPAGLDALLTDLTCLQCRALLLEYLLKAGFYFPGNSWT